MDQVGKRIKVDAGFVPVEHQVPHFEFQTWAKLPIRCLQWVLSMLSVPDLVSLDTASCSRETRKKLFDAYAYSLGLRSEAADRWFYASLRSIRWMMQRGVCLHDFVLELPQASAAANQKNSRRTLMQPNVVSRAWPTFHWLACYGLSPQQDNSDVVRRMAATGSRSCLEKTDNNGWTALHLACDMGDHRLVRLLVGRGDLRLDYAPRSTRPNDRPCAALERAAIWGSPECVKALLAGGAAIPPAVLDAAVKRAGNGRLADSNAKSQLANAENTNTHDLRIWEQQRQLFPRSMHLLDCMREQQGYQWSFTPPSEGKTSAAGMHRQATAGLCAEIIRIVLSAASRHAALALLQQRNSDNRTALEEAQLIGTAQVVEALQAAEADACAEEGAGVGAGAGATGDLVVAEQLAELMDEDVAVSALLSMFAI